MLELLNHNDREAVVIGYGLQQKIISENFTITELKEYVAENIKMPGNNINKYSYEKAKNPIIIMKSKMMTWKIWIIL